MRTALLLMLLLASVPAVGAPRPSSCRDGMITNPHWLNTPHPEQLTRYYPLREQVAAVDGHSLIDCVVQADGRLRDCVVISESPANAGFGQAALKLARWFRIAPQSCGGRPIGGKHVRIPIHWAVS
jgi:protein TonB